MSLNTKISKINLALIKYVFRHSTYVVDGNTNSVSYTNGLLSVGKDKVFIELTCFLRMSLVVSTLLQKESWFDISKKLFE